MVNPAAGERQESAKVLEWPNENSELDRQTGEIKPLLFQKIRVNEKYLFCLGVSGFLC